MKFKNLVVIVPLAFALAACGKSSTDSATEEAATKGAVSSTPAIPTTAPAPAPVTPPPTTSGSGGIPGPTTTNPSRNYYAYYRTGTGTADVYSDANDIVADSKLRVSINPGSAGATSGTGGTQNYAAMSATVVLMKDGMQVASVDVPGKDGGSQYASAGVKIGSNSNPALADFSSFLNGNARYSIKITNVRTDYKCNTYCTAGYYGCYSYSQYQYCQYGWTWNWDYHQGNWACCPGGIDILNQCQRQQCGTGTPNTNASWSLTIKVETDITAPIQ